MFLPQQAIGSDSTWLLLIRSISRCTYQAALRRSLGGVGAVLQPGAPEVFDGVADVEIVVLGDGDALYAAGVLGVVRRVVDGVGVSSCANI